jgi:transposase
VVEEDGRARLLDTLPGVAPYTALILSSALDDVDRLPDSKHACAYLGLVPSLHQSGGVTLTGHITKEGNKWLRRNIVECARVAVRKDPHLREFYLRLKHKKGGEEGPYRRREEAALLLLLDAEEELNLRGALSLEVDVRKSS